jgi:hypothetical protein
VHQKNCESMNAPADSGSECAAVFPHSSAVSVQW